MPPPYAVKVLYAVSKIKLERPEERACRLKSDEQKHANGGSKVHF